MVAPSKEQRRLALVAQRKASPRLPRHKCLADFHDGIFECDFVSPWTKSGCNVDAAVMVIGQDWASADMLEKNPRHVAERGYDDRLATNRRLDDLLRTHLRLARADCYLTNLFVFIKPGGASARIPAKDLHWSAQTFTIPEIEIVSPKLVICLGLVTFRALSYVAGQRQPRTMADAVSSPWAYGATMVHCVAHTGAFGTMNRSKEQVDADWQSLGRVLGK